MYIANKSFLICSRFCFVFSSCWPRLLVRPHQAVYPCRYCIQYRYCTLYFFNFNAHVFMLYGIALYLPIL